MDSLSAQNHNLRDYARKFQPKTIDKVERLFDLLEEMQRHPVLKGKLAMFGGTAINLFMLDIPRLSVDIDIAYIGAVDKSGMLSERKKIEHSIEDVSRFLGYNVSANKGGHAGRTFVLNYMSDWGTDHIKIDCIYLNRSPLFAPRLRQSSFRPDANVLMLENAELAGGKVKAFFDRVKIRDLYDISNLKKFYDANSDSANDGCMNDAHSYTKQINGERNDDSVIHKTLLYYASISARFPQQFQGRSERFSDLQNEYEKQLIPMLRLENCTPSIDKLILDAEQFIEKYILPRNESEQLYLEQYSKGIYQPELLFDDDAILSAAKVNPQALWKLENIKKMKCNQ